jgi:L-2,4-diaminobutyric acid acetyltransferase
MIITKATGEDVFEIHRFIGNLEGLVQHPVHFYKIMIEYFGNSFFVIKTDDKVIGFVWGFVSQRNSDVFFLWQIGVSKEHRGKDIARKLIDRLITSAKELQYKKIHATVETGNIASCKLFEKYGFTNISKGNTVVENGRKAIANYYGSGTNQVLYELDNLF